MWKQLVLVLVVITIAAVPALSQPETAAPDPTQPANEVTSLFSNMYDNVTVDTWSAEWDDADVEDIQIDGNDTKLYTNLVFAGIEFTSEPLDVSMREYFHLDIWTPDPTELPAQFRVKLVDFGPDGVFGGGDDTEHELIFDANSGLVSEQWVALDIPMSAFANMTNRTAVAQLILSGDPNTVYVDNVYFHGIDDGPDPEPTGPAPAPTQPSDEVTSLFSNAYDNVTVDTWSAEWDQADLEDIQIDGNDTKLYTNMVFAGIEFTSEPLDVTMHETFHIDIWTPDPTGLPAAFRVKLVDFGPDGVFGGDDDSEFEIAIDAEDGLMSEEWVSIDIPMSAFVGLTNQTAIAQMILSGEPNTLYVDNVYWHNTVVGQDPVPTEAAPVPTHPADEVISLFSDEYEDVTVDTWSADWDQADVEDIQIDGNTTKLYTNMVFAGIEFTSEPIDASMQEYFHLDIWTPDPTELPAAFRVKLVDFGPDGVFGGDDDSEHEITIDANSGLVSEQWISLDIPMSDFTGLTNVTALAQLILSGDLGTVYVDNVYFYENQTDVSEEGRVLPNEFDLVSVYPNPFNPTTTVQVALQQRADVRVMVYNSLGQVVATLATGSMQPGVHALRFDGSAQASGMYYVQAVVNGKPSAMKRMLLLK